MKTEILQVEGMSCQHCVNAIKKSLAALEGTSEVEVDLSGKKVTIAFDPAQVTRADLVSAIVEAGYEVVD